MMPELTIRFAGLLTGRRSSRVNRVHTHRCVRMVGINSNVARELAAEGER